jgi:hypothetical protein
LSRLIKIVISFTTILCIFIFSACSNEEQTKNKPNNQNIIVEKEYIPPSKDHLGKYKGTFGDNLIVDASVDVPNIEKASILQVENVIFEENQIRDIFFGSKQLKKEKNPKLSTYSIGNNKLRIMKTGDFTYNTSYSDDISTVFDSSANGNMDKYKLKELAFMTKEEAVKKASELLKKINITPYGTPNVYSLDYISLKKEEDRLMREDRGFKDFIDMGKIKLKDNWSKNDDCYYISFRIGINGFPVSSVSYVATGSRIPLPGSYVNVIISKNGIDYFSTNAIYREKSSTGNGSSLISIEQALDILNKKYNTVIVSDKLTVTNISLVYTSKYSGRTGETINIELIPTWIFDVNQKVIDGKSDKDMNQSVIVRINAINGKEIL